MEIIIHIEKKKLDTDYSQAIAEYVKRLSAFCRVRCLYYKDFSKLSLHTGSACFQIVPGFDTPSSEEFADMLATLTLSGYSRLEFVIGNPDSTNFDSRKALSLSGFSMSDDLTTVVLTEQLYRAYTILHHITYHK